MYTEIIKIIEGGLLKDDKKVLSYSKHLASKLHQNGDEKLAAKILTVLNNKKGAPVFQDKLFTSPVDSETRLNIASIVKPDEIENELLLSNQIKDSIGDFVKIVRSKNKLNELGIDVYTSMLLYGPPGSGKTSIAKFIAKELNLPIIIARFDSLISSLLGNTSKNIRKLFEYASSRPCILFLDEFDAIAKARNDSQEMGELKRVINSLLQNIDEFTQNNILIAATNHEELLDKAIWRRFEKVINVTEPSNTEIVELLKLFLKKRKVEFLDDDKKLKIISSELSSLSTSEIKKIAINALTQNIIHDRGNLKFEDLLHQIYLYRNHGKLNNDKLVKYLNETGVSQNTIKDSFNIPIRQIRNILNQEL